MVHGALKIIKSSVTLFGGIFRRNKARCYGGAIFADRSYVSIDSENLTAGASQFLHDLFLENHIPTPGSALFFKNEAYDRGGAMYLQDSSVLLSGTVIKFMNNSARESGGAMFFKQEYAVTQLVTNVKHLYFTGNKAHGTTYTRAGAIYADGASLIFGESAKNFHNFLNNFPTAIFCQGNDNVIKITGNSFFISNGYYNYHAGGAIRILGPEITIKGNAIFHYNLAKDFGGAILLMLYLMEQTLSSSITLRQMEERYTALIQILQSELSNLPLLVILPPKLVVHLKCTMHIPISRQDYLVFLSTTLQEIVVEQCPLSMSLT